MLTDRFCFVHIPRMGGSAFKALCQAHITPILGHTGHRTGADLGWLTVPRVLLLRDPWSWYRSVTAQAALVAGTIEGTYAATVRRYACYGDGVSPAVDRVYPWPWSTAAARLLRDASYDPMRWGSLDTFRTMRATPEGLYVDAPQPSAEDIVLWEAYGPAD